MNLFELKSIRLFILIICKKINNKKYLNYN